MTEIEKSWMIILNSIKTISNTSSEYKANMLLALIAEQDTVCPLNIATEFANTCINEGLDLDLTGNCVFPTWFYDAIHLHAAIVQKSH